MFEELVHELESRLYEMGRHLWQPDPLAQAEEQAQQTRDALSKCLGALRRACRERATAQRRLRANRDLLAHLPALIRRCVQGGRGPEAWQHALALDRARLEIAADEANIPRLGQVCWSLQFQARQLQRHLSRLQKQLTDA